MTPEEAALVEKRYLSLLRTALSRTGYGEAVSEIGCAPCLTAAQVAGVDAEDMVPKRCEVCILRGKWKMFGCLSTPYGGVTAREVTDAISLGSTWESIPYGYIRDREPNWRKVLHFLVGHIRWAREYK